ncbi:MAG TPA: helix-turn-helix domain-containing protein [Noviherbaspirillum sp.]|nr:helix-turn-helix domain-containing protein [Noviherbaspirillum sp.]
MTRRPAAPAVERNREQTTARILAAVGEVLARDGFAALGVNAIAKEAGVDKVLIYRYFGGLPELLAAWAQSGRFWPGVDEILGADPDAFFALSAPERFARFFDLFIDSLRQRPITLEIMVAELVERNELTAVLEAEREAWGQRAVQMLGGEAFAARPDLQGLALLLVAGVQYLVLRSRKIRIYGGVDIQSDEGWNALKSSLRAAAYRLF